ncbi:MAG: prolipoprotein diacylglyceryl transferase family protein [Acidobacteriota bacterium]
MHPILLDSEFLGVPLRITSYGAAMALAIIVGWLLVSHFGRQRLPQAPWADFYFGIILGGLLGAKLLLVVVRWPDLRSGAASWGSVLAAGGIWLGGVLGALVVGGWFVLRHRLPPARTADTLFLGLPLAHAIGRAGCLLTGCCYGDRCDLPWAIVYTDPAAQEIAGTPLGVPLHPSPAYEMVAELINFTVLLLLNRRRPAPGALAATWMALYGSQRFMLELLRGDDRGGLGLLSTSQWISVAMIASAAIFFWISRRR